VASITGFGTGAEEVVVDVTAEINRRDVIGVLLGVELSAETPSSASVIGDENGSSDG